MTGSWAEIPELVDEPQALLFRSAEDCCRVLHAETENLRHVAFEDRVRLEAMPADGRVQLVPDGEPDRLWHDAGGPVRLRHSQTVSSGASTGIAGHLQWANEF